MTDIIYIYLHYALNLYLWFIVAIYLRNKYEAGQLSGPLKYPAFVVVYAFIIADIAYNWLISIPFGEAPRDWKETTSMRLARYVQDFTHPTRRFFARAIGKALNIVDPGHIPGA